MQDHTLVIKSFIENNVRNSIIPLLSSYLEDRIMTVKWRDEKSSKKCLPGGGAQGTILGPLEFFSQTNESANCVPEDKRFKFVDDLSTIEVIQLVSNVVSYNFKAHVASDIGTHGQYIPGTNLKSQRYSSNINEWTVSKKMKLNEKKTKFMLFNYTNKWQFNTRIYINNALIEQVQETPLIGLTIQENLR